MFDEAKFSGVVQQWITEFQEGLGPMNPEILRGRVRSYLKQEDHYREKVRFLLHLLPVRPRAGLDIGSSAGGLSVALGLEGIEMEGIEPSEKGVTASAMRADRYGLSNVHFQQGVGESVSFPDSAFDLVISLAVLEHVADVERVVAEAYRVLKPGGHAYFEVPNNLCPFEGHYKMVWLPMMPKPLAKSYVSARGASPKFLDHLHYMNRWIVMRHFRRAGFVQMKDVYSDYLSGKAAGEPWAERSGRLAQMPWSAGLLRWLCGPLPTAWLVNRAVCLIARKPE